MQQVTRSGNYRFPFPNMAGSNPLLSNTNKAHRSKISHTVLVADVGVKFPAL